MQSEYDLLTDMTAELYANRIMLGRLLQAVSQLADNGPAYLSQLAASLQRDADGFELHSPNPERQAMMRKLIAAKLQQFLAGLPTDAGQAN